jgi:hypothetical protein
MSLMDLIVDNLFFVIIIFWIVVSFLKRWMRSLPGEADRQERGNSIPPFGGDHIPVERERNTRPPEPQQAVPAAHETKRSPLHTGSVQEYGRPAAKLGSAAARARTAASDPDGNKLDEFGVEINAKQAVQGMMWAEVFGAPRAKKPFRYGGKD